MKIITLIRRKLIGNYLIAAEITFESVMYQSRLHFNWTFSKVAPGSSIWQMYQKRHEKP